MYVTNVHPFPKKYIMGEESFSVTFFFPIVKSLSTPPTLLQTEKRRNKTQNETLLPLKHSDPCHHRRPWQPPPLTPQDQSTTVFLSNPSSLICSLIPLLLFSCQLCPTLQPHELQHAGLSYPHHLLELAQTHGHCVNDAIQPFHPLSSPSPPAFNLSQHQGLLQSVGSWHQLTKVLEPLLQHQSFQ